MTSVSLHHTTLGTWVTLCGVDGFGAIVLVPVSSTHFWHSYASDEANLESLFMTNDQFHRPFSQHCYGT